MKDNIIAGGVIGAFALSVVALFVNLNTTAKVRAVEQTIVAEVERRVSEQQEKQQAKNDAFVDYNNFVGDTLKQVIVRVGNLEGQRVVDDSRRSTE